MQLIWFLVIGATAGWLADLIMQGRGGNLLLNLLIGVVGAVIGGFLFSALGLSAHGLLGNLIMATSGAVVLLFLINLFKRR